MFPGGEYNSAYEAGFCGYGIHRRLNHLGINNIVINAAEIPTTQKDKLQKRVPVDSRKIARSLEKGSFHGIHIFDQELEELRSLNRTRFYLMRDLRGISLYFEYLNQHDHWGNPVRSRFSVQSSSSPDRTRMDLQEAIPV